MSVEKVKMSWTVFGIQSSELDRTLTSKDNIPEEISIMNPQDAIKNIKTFDSTSKHSNLENFLSSCEEAFDYSKDVESKKLLLKHNLNVKASTCKT